MPRRARSLDRVAVDLGDDVARFVAEVTEALGSLSGRPPATHTRECLIEASNIIAGVIDADGATAIPHPARDGGWASDQLHDHDP